MKPERNSHLLLSITRAKSKMWEYGVKETNHIRVSKAPSNLFPLAIAMLGDLAVLINTTSAPDELEPAKAQLRFSSQFFESYKETRITQALDQILDVLAAASHILSDNPGSAYVVAKAFHHDELAKSSDIERALIWLVKGNLNAFIAFNDVRFAEQLTSVAQILGKQYSAGEETEHLSKLLDELRGHVYDVGTHEEIFLTDVFCAVARIKDSVSAWKLLPLATGISKEVWQPSLLSANFIKELWPSQRVLADQGIFRGKSAVIQMPTGAGKTKSIEILIRSSFLSNRSHLCVVVAPFKALCHEITASLTASFKDSDVVVNEMNDVLQRDFSTEALLEDDSKQILVLTPEKLLYVLRQSPEVAANIGLLILDEGHQFDSGLRGVTYELLIATLKSLIPAQAQKILISAVIANAASINEWFNDEEGVLISSGTLPSTFRSIGFTSWMSSDLRIDYVKNDNIREQDFFVPFVLRSQNLALRGREAKPRLFPNPKDGATVASALGLSVVKNGAVAIFCGQKATATKICQTILAAFERDFVGSAPSEFSDVEELERIANLYDAHFGDSSLESKSARLGFLVHHASIPNGLRLATEFAIREGYAKYIICTSTLAQGVNLPLKYLIFTSIFQAGERLKTRDFHNLIGRAGRSGIQTEGTILFADPGVFDNRNSFKKGRMFRSIEEMMNPSNTEPCASSLLSIFDLIRSDDRKVNHSSTLMSLLREFFEDETAVDRFIDTINASEGFSRAEVLRQVKYKFRIYNAIESYLVTALQSIATEERAENARQLAKATLAHKLASVQQKSDLEELFALISQRIDSKIMPEIKRPTYSRTLIGVSDLLDIDDWISEHGQQIAKVIDDEDAFFELIFPLIKKYMQESDLLKVLPVDCQFRIARSWISGSSYRDMIEMLSEFDTHLKAKSQTRKITLMHLVDICENELAFDGMLIVGALVELFQNHDVYRDTVASDVLRAVQKRIKYGLPSSSAVAIYESGFRDRVVSQELAAAIAGVEGGSFNIRHKLVECVEEVAPILSKYPSYFERVYVDLF